MVKAMDSQGSQSYILTENYPVTLSESFFQPLHSKQNARYSNRQQQATDYIYIQVH